MGVPPYIIPKHLPIPSCFSQTMGHRKKKINTKMSHGFKSKSISSITSPQEKYWYHD
jgi:hypothetical protein